MDSAPWHKKTMRLVETEKRPEYSDIRESVTFIKLPPYSLDLNPIEQVWRITRKENTHNVFFASCAPEYAVRKTNKGKRGRSRKNKLVVKEEN